MPSDCLWWGYFCVSRFEDYQCPAPSKAAYYFPFVALGLFHHVVYGAEFIEAVLRVFQNHELTVVDDVVGVGRAVLHHTEQSIVQYKEELLGVKLEVPDNELVLPRFHLVACHGIHTGGTFRCILFLFLLACLYYILQLVTGPYIFVSRSLI